MAQLTAARQDDWLETGTCFTALSDGFHALRWTELDLASFSDGWQSLARQAGTPNPFYEAWFLLPSLQHLDPDGKVHLALLIDGGRLVALMPSCLDHNYHGRWLPHMTSWLHANLFSGAPLVAPGHERAFWEAYLACLDTMANSALFLHLPLLPEQSPATSALLALCEASERSCRVVQQEQRALLLGGATPEEHLEASLGAKKRKELRRQRKRLEELGVVTVERRRGTDGCGEWIEEFLALEAGGWKGRNGSALVSDRRTAALFRQIVQGAAEQSQLERLALRLDGRAIAMLVTFIGAPGAFSYKTAFDDTLARYSPGVLLQLENLALLDDPALAWCDSCAAPDHPMIERLWRDRVGFGWYTVAIGGTLRRQLGSFYSWIEARSERAS